MDTTTIILLFLIVAMLVWSVTRRRRPVNDNLSAAIALITDIDYDLKVLDERRSNNQSNKLFKVGGWERYRAKLGFLDTELVSSLNEVFGQIGDFNARIKTARKNKAFGTLQDMPLEITRDRLNICKQGLIQWLKSSAGTNSQSSRPGCMGF